MNHRRIALAELDRALHRTAQAERIAPGVYDDINYRRREVALSTPNPDNRGSGGVSDPTSRIATERAALDIHPKRILNAIMTIHAAIDHLDECMRDALGRQYADIANHRTCWCGELSATIIRPRDLTVTERQDGLCATHGRQADVAERRAEQANSRRSRRYASN